MIEEEWTVQTWYEDLLIRLSKDNDLRFKINRVIDTAYSGWTKYAWAENKTISLRNFLREVKPSYRVTLR